MAVVLGLGGATAYVVRDVDGSAPVVGAWRQLSPPPDVAAHFNLLAWTGTEVLVIGGSDGEYSRLGGDPPPEFVTSGAAYDVATGTWRRVADAPVPLGTGSSSAIASGDRLLVVDGDGDWWQYDASADAWTGLTPPPDAGPQPFLAQQDGRVYTLSAEYGHQARVAVLDVASGTWSALFARPRPRGLQAQQLEATADGVAVLGIRSPAASYTDPPAADLFDGTSWRRTVGPPITVGSQWHWTGERLVMPLPDLDHILGNRLGLALDVATGRWSRIPEGPFYEDGGWGVVAADGPRVWGNGYVYDDATGTWTVVRHPSSDMGPLEGQEIVAGVVADDRLVVVGEGTAWISPP